MVIRCSARVQEKQEKLRRESSPSKQILPLEVNCSSAVTTGGGTGTLASSNASKGSVKYPSPNNNEPTSTGGEVGANPLIVPGLEEKRKKRTWELWSLEDKQMFFEALNEHGKDFDAIQNYLASKAKSRKSGTTTIERQYAPKNKDQGKLLLHVNLNHLLLRFFINRKCFVPPTVRHFYYRTWNKISKYLRYPDGKLNYIRLLLCFDMKFL